MLSLARVSAVVLLGLTAVQALSIPMVGSQGDLPAKRSFRGKLKTRDLGAGAVAASERRRALAEKRKAKLAARKAATSTNDKRATRQKYQSTLISSLETAASSILAAVIDPNNPYAPGSTFESTPDGLAASSRRCGNDGACGSLSVPENGSAICGTNARCMLICNAGFGPSGTSCVDTSTCGGTACTAPANGFNTCSATNTCSPQCNPGYTAATSGTSTVCIDLASDASNCGAIGFACPTSYNGIGNPRCYNSVCTLSCPAYMNPRVAQSATNPHYCA